jgi:hypothetical protein
VMRSKMSLMTEFRMDGDALLRHVDLCGKESGRGTGKARRVMVQLPVRHFVAATSDGVPSAQTEQT